jgi:Ser/Thr protein kinase RdoA (MazF antagonist)
VQIDARLRAWVEAQLGGARGWSRVAASAPLFGVYGPDGRAWVVKQHRSARAFAQEREALGWFGHELGGARVPQLRAADVELRALVCERLPGQPVTGAALPALDLHRAAGRFLASLHQLAQPDHDPMPVADALARRLETWRRRARLTPEQLALVDAHGPRPSLFAGAVRVPCHRDFAPRNWLWTGTQLGVVDFEHARLDLGLGDLCKLAVDCWDPHPPSKAAFLAGYGRDLSALEHAQLGALIVLHGLASLAWGQERGVVEHVDEGQRALGLAARQLG